MKSIFSRSKRRLHRTVLPHRGGQLGLALVLLSAISAPAFSLLGPYASWMTPTNGFQLVGDIGGPMPIGEGYRWNVPVVTYDFDTRFMAFFGSNGVAAVQSAIQILNALPPASQADPNAYPLNAVGENFTAYSQGLVDLKSVTLFLLLQQLGLASPQRFMFCVHDFSIAGGNTNVDVIMRSFDPFSFAGTNILNGAFYSSNLIWQTAGQVQRVFIYAVPMNPSYVNPAVADGLAGSSPGLFYTGLTRDDIGGWHYLLQTNNLNFETLLPDVHGVGVNSNNYVNLALRGGIDKITFVQKTMDPLTGLFATPVTNQFTDTYVTNGIPRQQQLERVTYRPDIVFSAYTAGSNQVPVTIESTGTSNWLNNASLNGSSDLAGPGTIRPQVAIAFPKYGLNAIIITSDPNNVIQASNERWASFDGSTNPPVIYPVGTSGTGNPWTINFSLLNTNYQSLRGGYFTWQLPVSLGTAVNLESSTNLTNWTTLTTVINYGVPILWEHLYSRPAGYFRVVTQ
jgi:hypothetical protein